MMPTRSRRAERARSIVLAATFAAGLASAPLAASAQDRRVAAEAAFDEGLALYEKGDLAAACPKLAAAVDLTDRSSLGGLLLYAQCEEKLGHTATAWALFREVAAKADRAAQNDRALTAREGEARLAPKLHQLVVRVPPAIAALPSLRVERGKAEVTPELYGAAVPVDPGAVRVRATAPGHRAFEKDVVIPSEPGKTEIVIEPLPEDSQPPPGPSARPGTAGSDEAPRGGLGALGITGLVTAGVGLAGTGVSALIMVGAKSSYDDAVAPCSEGVCTSADDKAAADDARATGDIGTAVFIGGIALTTIGAALFVVDLASTPGDGGRTTGIAVGPSGVSLRARY